MLVAGAATVVVVFIGAATVVAGCVLASVCANYIAFEVFITVVLTAGLVANFLTVVAAVKCFANGELFFVAISDSRRFAVAVVDVFTAGVIMITFSSRCFYLLCRANSVLLSSP